MRALALLTLASLALVSALPAPASAAATATLEINLTAVGYANATFHFKGSGAGLGSHLAFTTVNGVATIYAALDPALGPHSLKLNTSASPGWKVGSSSCTMGSLSNIGLAAGVTTKCWVNLTHGTPETPKPPKTSPRHDDHDDDDDDRRGHDRSWGGGPGAWKNADRRVAEARLNGWVANVSAASAWLMPAGYAATGDGARDLLEDSTRGCSKRDRLACETLRFQARYLVLRLNLASGAGNASASVHLSNATAAYLALPTHTTVSSIVNAIEAKAGGAAETRDELRMLRHVSQRASAHSLG